ncbi:MAG: 4Fe-4S binding protein [Candidatus Saelkia tenebricola]|nr:4Fe-4S binding protein [Candidatus Saelkia tenebricola]
MKKSQKIMIWFLLIIVIGGLFYPLLGYLVVGMMAFFLTLSYFKGRYWCWNYCPRGALLDGLISKVSFKKPLPKIFTKMWFRWLVFVVFISVFLLRIIHIGGDLFAIGAMFVSMCLITTIVAIVLGVSTKQRAWCAICPMGTLQDKMGKIFH